MEPDGGPLCRVNSREADRDLIDHAETKDSESEDSGSQGMDVDQLVIDLDETRASIERARGKLPTVIIYDVRGPLAIRKHSSVFSPFARDHLDHTLLYQLLLTS